MTLQRIGHLMTATLFGIIFMLVSFPNLTRSLIQSTLDDTWIARGLVDIVNGVQGVYGSLIGDTPETIMRRMMFLCSLGVMIYILLLIIFAIRHFDLRSLVYGFGGLFAGIYIFHAIIWGGVLIFAIWGILLFLFSGLVNLLGFLFNFLQVALPYLIGFVVALIGLGLIAGIVQNEEARLPLIIASVIFAVIVFAGYQYSGNIFDFLQWALFPVMWLIGTVSAYLVYFILSPLLSILTFLLAIFLVLIFYFTVPGYFVFDQFRAAWDAGDGRKGIVMGAFGLGSAIALLLLLCMASPRLVVIVNLGWGDVWRLVDDTLGTGIRFTWLGSYNHELMFTNLLPPVPREYLLENLRQYNFPLFDLAIIMCVFVLSFIGILRRTIRLPDVAVSQTQVTFLPIEIIVIFVGLAVGFAATVLQVDFES